jgi:hypothetical protein
MRNQIRREQLMLGRLGPPADHRPAAKKPDRFGSAPREGLADYLRVENMRVMSGGPDSSRGLLDLAIGGVAATPSDASAVDAS